MNHKTVAYILHNIALLGVTGLFVVAVMSDTESTHQTLLILTYLIAVTALTISWLATSGEWEKR